MEEEAGDEEDGVRDGRDETKTIKMCLVPRGQDLNGFLWARSATEGQSGFNRTNLGHGDGRIPLSSVGGGTVRGNERRS